MERSGGCHVGIKGAGFDRDGDGFHDIITALSKPNGDNEKRSICCNACKFPFYVCSKLHTVVGVCSQDNILSPNIPAEAYSDAQRVICDIEKKFFCYMQHRCRVVRQRVAISEIRTSLKSESTISKIHGSRLLVTIDWKMKFETMFSRETMQQHYGETTNYNSSCMYVNMCFRSSFLCFTLYSFVYTGKRGIGWHGNMIQFYRWNVDTGEADEHVVYIDQIMNGGNKQDAAAVVSMLEAALIGMTKIVSEAREVIVLSDNAGCYQSVLFVILIGLLNKKLYAMHRIYVSRVLHTETQDGKSTLDAHFAHAMAFTRRYMLHSKRNRTRKIVTADGLAAALSWKNGLTNSIVQLNVSRA
jgi:hypothetical protein